MMDINHHGKSIKPETNDDDEILITRVIPSPVQNIKPKDLVSRNEETQVKALRNHYENLDNKEKENIRKLNFCLRFAHVYSPTVVISFVCIYWLLGLRQAEFF